MSNVARPRAAGDWALLARTIFVAALAFHVFAFFSLFFGYLDPFFDNTDRGGQGIDFFAIYKSAEFLLHGDSIYTIDFMARYGVPPASPYRYLPFFATTFGVALQALSAWNAYWMWVSVNEVMLAANALVSFRVAAHRSWSWVCAAMWFAFTPVYIEQYMGQFSLLMATFMLWTAVLLERQRATGAALPWTASLLVKTNTALFAPIFLRMREFRLVAVVAIVVLAVNVPYFAAVPDDLRKFWDINVSEHLDREPLPRYLINSGDMGFIALVETAWFAIEEDALDLPAGVTPAIVVAVIAVTLAATFAARRLDVLALFAIWSLAYFLVYTSWEHHYVMLLPALVLLVALRPDCRMLALAIFVLLALPTPYAIFDRAFEPAAPEGTPVFNLHLRWPAWATVVQHAVKPLPVLALWAVLCARELRGARRERGASSAVAVTTANRGAVEPTL